VLQRHKVLANVAIYRFEAQIIQRSKGRSASASAAYRGGLEITDERTGEMHDYSRKQGVLDHAIITPSRAPDWAKSSATLWNAAEVAEKRCDAQLCREFMLPLPHELTLAQNRELLHGFVKDSLVRRGMAVQADIHAPHRRGDQRNIHGHLMMTMRQITRNGFKEKKVREWNKTTQLTQWRKEWAEHVNRALEKAKVNDRVDHRSNKARGLDRAAEIHMGPAATAMERRGEKTRVGEHNKAVREFNKLQEQAKIIDLAIVREKAQAAKEQPEIWDREADEIKRQKRLSDAAMETARREEQKAAAKTTQRQIPEGIRRLDNAFARAGTGPRPPPPGNDNRSREEIIRKAALLSPDQLEQWKGTQQAKQQSRQLEERGEIGRRYERKRMMLEDRQSQERGGDIRQARKTLAEIEARQQKRGVKGFLYHHSARAEQDRVDAENTRKSLDSALWRVAEERGALQRGRREEETRLDTRHRAEQRELAKLFTEIDAVRQQRGPVPEAQKTPLSERVRREREAFEERQRAAGRGRDFDYER
jgi:hypothetical protein